MKFRIVFTLIAAVVIALAFLFSGAGPGEPVANPGTKFNVQ